MKEKKRKGENTAEHPRNQNENSVALSCAAGIMECGRSLEAVQALEGEPEGSATSAVLVDDDSTTCCRRVSYNVRDNERVWCFQWKSSCDVVERHNHQARH